MGLFNDIFGVVNEFKGLKDEATSAISGVVNDFVSLKNEATTSAAQLKDEAISTAAQLKGEAMDVKNEFAAGVDVIKKNISNN